jgi:hypothetical protein
VTRVISPRETKDRTIDGIETWHAARGGARDDSQTKSKRWKFKRVQRGTAREISSHMVSGVSRF